MKNFKIYICKPYTHTHTHMIVWIFNKLTFKARPASNQNPVWDEKKIINNAHQDRVGMLGWVSYCNPIEPELIKYPYKNYHRNILLNPRK